MKKQNKTPNMYGTACFVRSVCARIIWERVRMRGAKSNSTNALASSSFSSKSKSKQQYLNGQHQREEQTVDSDARDEVRIWAGLQKNMFPFDSAIATPTVEDINSLPKTFVFKDRQSNVMGRLYGCNQQTRDFVETLVWILNG